MVQKFISDKRGVTSCDKSIVITDSETGEIICQTCGKVLQEKTEDSGKEWRVFDSESRIRVGARTSLASYDMGLSTVIGSTNMDGKGKHLSSSMKYTVRRLKMQDSRSHINTNIRKYNTAFRELYRLRDKLALSDNIMEKAAYIYRKAKTKELIRGRNISAMMAASLYVACRKSETPRTLKDLSDAINIKKRDIASCYRLLIKEMNLDIPNDDPIKCVSRIASVLKLSEKTKRHAVEILRRAKECEITSGKNPIGLAATAIYLSCMITNELHTQNEIARIANISTVTIRNRIKSLKNL